MPIPSCIKDGPISNGWVLKENYFCPPLVVHFNSLTQTTHQKTGDTIYQLVLCP